MNSSKKILLRSNQDFYNHHISYHHYPIPPPEDVWEQIDYADWEKETSSTDYVLTLRFRGVSLGLMYVNVSFKKVLISVFCRLPLCKITQIPAETVS